MLGISVAGVKEKVLVRIDRIFMGNMLKWWERSQYLMFGTYVNALGTPPSLPSSPHSHSKVTSVLDPNNP